MRAFRAQSVWVNERRATGGLKFFESLTVCLAVSMVLSHIFELGRRALYREVKVGTRGLRNQGVRTSRAASGPPGILNT